MGATPGVARTSAAQSAVRVLKLAISVFYRMSDLSLQQVRRWLGNPQTGSTVVLYYHSVPDAYRERFEEQVQTLVRKAAAADIFDMDAPDEGRHSVAITFDDALESFAVNAVPVLEQFNLPVTVFAVADSMGGQPVWGEGYFSADERVMTAEMLRSLPKNVTVGSHTLTHPNLLKLRSPEAAREIGESRQRLEQMLGHPVTLFSFPFGEFDDSTVRQCFEAGYERVFTTEPELICAGHNPFVVGRVAADPWDWPLEFRLKIAGAYCWQPLVRSWRNRIRNRFWAKDTRISPMISAARTAHRSRGI